MQPVDREGTFKAKIESYGLKEMDTGAVAVTINAHLTDIWNGEGWEPWGDYQQEALGDLWIIKKSGEVNKGQVEALVQHTGWDGDIASIVDEKWNPKPCVVVVKADTYKDQTRFKIAFVNDIDRAPGGMGNVDSAKAKELQARFGAQLRAVAGAVKRNGTPPPASKPAAPPPPAKPAQRVEPGFEPIPH